MQDADLPFLFFGHFTIEGKVAEGTQMVRLLRRAFLQPEFRAGQTLLEVFILIGHPDLAEDRFQHGDVEVHDGAQLHQQSHRHGLDGLPVREAVVHDGTGEFIRPAFAEIGVLFVEFKVLAQDAVVKAEVESLGRLALRVKPQHHFRLVELQDGVGRQVQTGGAAHLAGDAFDADEFVALEQRGFVAEDLLRHDFPIVVAAAGARVVLSAGFEVNALVGPAHRPVHLPGQLAVGIFREVEVAFMSAGAGIVRHGAVFA